MRCLIFSKFSDIIHNMLWGVFSSKKSFDESQTVRKAVNRDLIAEVYREREQDIESLRQYDRGEKVIHAPNLGSFVRSL